MVILDENIDEAHWNRLRRWHIKARQIGRDIGRAGMSDSQIISLLHEANDVTFFTLDHGFKRDRFCHSRYCLAFLDVLATDVDVWIRRFLDHSEFNTQAKRLGSVVEVSAAGLIVWRLPQRQMERVPWLPH